MEKEAHIIGGPVPTMADTFAALGVRHLADLIQRLGTATHAERLAVGRVLVSHRQMGMFALTRDFYMTPVQKCRHDAAEEAALWRSVPDAWFPDRPSTHTTLAFFRSSWQPHDFALAVAQPDCPHCQAGVQRYRQTLTIDTLVSEEMKLIERGFAPYLAS